MSFRSLSMMKFQIYKSLVVVWLFSIAFCLSFLSGCKSNNTNEKTDISILENEEWFAFKCNNSKPFDGSSDKQCDTLTFLVRKDVPLPEMMVYSWTFLRFGQDRWLIESFEHTNERQCTIEDSRYVFPAGIGGQRFVTRHDTLLLFGNDDTKCYRVLLATRQVLHLVAIDPIVNSTE